MPKQNLLGLRSMTRWRTYNMTPLETEMEAKMSSSDFNRGKEIVLVQGTFERDTEKAELISFLTDGGTPKQHWLPKSQYGKDSEISDVSTGACKLYIPRWLAEKNEIEYEEIDKLSLEEAEWDDQDCFIHMMNGKGE